jgi:hypothetical protein
MDIWRWTYMDTDMQVDIGMDMNTDMNMSMNMNIMINVDMNKIIKINHFIATTLSSMAQVIRDLTFFNAYSSKISEAKKF